MEYRILAEVYEQLEKTSKRLEKTSLIAEFLKSIYPDDLEPVMVLLQGRVFPSYDDSKLGVATSLIMKAIAASTGLPLAKIESEWKETGDLGLVAERLGKARQQMTLARQSLSVRKVYDNLRKLPGIEGSGSVDRKLGLILELLSGASALEARYIIRTVLEDLRVGVGDGSLRDAIVWAYFGDQIEIRLDTKKEQLMIGKRDSYNEHADAVQHAIDLTNDLASVARMAKEQGISGLRSIQVGLGKPIKVMLAQKVTSVTEGLERVGSPAEVEYKYDGFRMQIHKGKEITIFTRRLENVTAQFPEIVRLVKDHISGDSFIIEGEAVGFEPKSGKYLPFQAVSQRIRRKYDIDRIALELPVELSVFDVLYHDGTLLLDAPLRERWALLERIIKPVEKKIILARHLVTGDEGEIEKFYQEALGNAQEGVMFKKLDAPYKPGARVGFMVKLKPAAETLDLVIVGAEWGEGKRSGWLSSYTLACVDDDGRLLTLGKSSTGLKEKRSEGLSFAEMTDILKPLVISEKGKEVKVKPEVVIEVGYQEIQKSPTYEAGYALRFPTVIRLRADRTVNDASTLSMIEEFYYGQKK